MYYLCEKSYKPLTVQYSTSDCVSLVPRLTLLDFMNKLDLSTCSRNSMRSYVGDILWSDHFILSMTKVRLERLSCLRPWYRLVAEAEPGFSSWFMTCYQRAGWSKPPLWYLAYVSCVLLVCACELDLVCITTLCTRGWDLLHLRHRGSDVQRHWPPCLRHTAQKWQSRDEHPGSLDVVSVLTATTPWHLCMSLLEETWTLTSAVHTPGSSTSRSKLLQITVKTHAHFQL